MTYDDETKRGIAKGIAMAEAMQIETEMKAMWGEEYERVIKLTAEMLNRNERLTMSDEEKLQMICDSLCAKHKAQRVVIRLEYENGSSLNFQSKGAANDR